MGLSDNSAINLYEVYGDVHSLNNSALLTLRSVLGPRSTNELKLQHLYTLEKSMPGSELPADNIPRAIVQRVESEIDGKRRLLPFSWVVSVIAPRISITTYFSW